MKNNLKRNLPRTMREIDQFAEKKINKAAFDWLNAGAEYGRTMKINEDAFNDVEIIPNFFNFYIYILSYINVKGKFSLYILRIV